jgi:peptide subunit release factor 1 (eRF1)
MKITLCIPEGKKFKQRLLDEIGVAENIKDKKHRQQIVSGLRKIVLNYQEGKAFLYDGDTEVLLAYDYKLKDFIYHCGKEFVVPEGKLSDSKYLLIVMDADNASIAYLHGKRIIPLWAKDSNVPRKQDAGGQSQRRFERGREEALKQWLKKVADKLYEFAK